MENQIFKLKKFINKLELNDNNLDKRSSSFNNFYKSGFPSKKLEDWKFIDLNQIDIKNISNQKCYGIKCAYMIENIVDEIVLAKERRACDGTYSA